MAARAYGKLFTKIWRQMRGQDLACKLLRVYVESSPHSNAIGIFELPLDYIKSDLELPADLLETAFIAFERCGYLDRCPLTDWIWIKGYLREHPPENESVARHWRRQAALVPDDLPFSQEFKIALREALEHSYAQAVARARKPTLNERLRTARLNELQDWNEWWPEFADSLPTRLAQPPDTMSSELPHPEPEPTPSRSRTSAFPSPFPKPTPEPAVHRTEEESSLVIEQDGAATVIDPLLGRPNRMKDGWARRQRK